ncbi:MAG TPA: pyridoxal phosphate-dependent aminotransferase [Burkholderiales bacterium]|jgi:aspartate/methionine/tyrosine aminotransferase|nr:pyridoxal phosphate-dependent aminotransferase [Burkholderiales bacterium]
MNAPAEISASTLASSGDSAGLADSAARALYARDGAPHQHAREGVHGLQGSKIREVANAAMGREGLLPFWFGEPDQVTPDFIRAAAIESLNNGETFYTHSFGIAPLREAIAAYVRGLHGGATSVANIAVTNSGMNALTLIFQALISPGDRVVAVTPLWPNLTQGPKILSADVHMVSLDFGRDGWTLNLQKLLDALTPGTRFLLINSPNNPTGWTMSRAEQEAVLAHCRKHGIWIVADDAYERLVFADNQNCAPSFLDIATPDDRVVSANTFSKSWMMTGWRLGWIVAPPPLLADLAKLIEFNICCAQSFVQRAGFAAVTKGAAVTQAFVARLKHGRDVLVPRLAQIDGVHVVAPPGAMYAFFKIDGVTDSLALCKHLAANHGLGLAPGVAFGPEGYVRWCFAASDERLLEGATRLERGLKDRPR